jgi:hypothetical protein
MCLGIRSEIGRNKFDEPKIHLQRLRDPVKRARALYPTFYPLADKFQRYSGSREMRPIRQFT